MIQEARARDTVAILAEMPDGETSEALRAMRPPARWPILTEMSPDLRGGAILDADGAVLAASGRPERWREDAATLLEVADGAGGEPVEQAHIATEQGEVFAVRHAGLAAVAVTDRFALASLLFFDMRSSFATSARAATGRASMPPKPHRVLLDRVSGYADEAAAYMRRRRVSRQPFARLYYPERPGQRPRRRLARRRRALRRCRALDRGRREAAEAMSELIDAGVAERVLAAGARQRR